MVGPEAWPEGTERGLCPVGRAQSSSVRRTASALEASASVLHAVDTPAIETAMGEASVADVASAAGASTSASARLPRRLRTCCLSAAVTAASLPGTRLLVGAPPDRAWVVARYG